MRRWRAMWWILALATFIDIIGIWSESWEISIINSGTEMAWIVGTDWMILIASLYNIGIVRNW